MLLFPQLLSGAVAQFPLKTKYIYNNVTNLQEDGSRYSSAGDTQGRISWTVSYQHLTQTESDSLADFFQKTSGRLTQFTFLDPSGNLLSWSEDLSKPVWQKSALLAFSGGVQDGTSVFQSSNGGAGASTLGQILPCPSAAIICFSVYAKSDDPVSLTLSASGVQRTFALDSNWKQYFVTQGGQSGTDTSTVQLSFEGGNIELSRLTVSPQPAPSGYTPTREASGAMSQTRFDQDILSITANGKDDLSCEVRLTAQIL